MGNILTKSDPLAKLEALQQATVDLIQIRDPRQLLTTIVNRAVDLLVCDAGSLYIRHSDRELVFEISVNRYMTVDLERRIVPSDSNGVAMYSYRKGETVSIQDVYDIPEGAPYAFDTRFDNKTGYRTKSVLAVPLITAKGEILGVLQLINRKNILGERWPVDSDERMAEMPSFDEEDSRYAASFAALATASLENANLYKSIENLFEGFVYASVGAIESRDRATRGHSERVAILCVELAQRISEARDTDLRGMKFTPNQISELRYAALLHDFGKIGVREQTLMKSEKLFPHQTTAIRHRLDEFGMAREIYELRGLLSTLIDEGRAPLELDLASVDRTIRKFKNRLDEYWDTILDINQPTVLDEDKTKFLHALQNVELMTANGQQQKLLQPNEIAALSIKRGSLSVTERKEIEEHVTRTYLFLREIPWTKEFSQVAEIAHAHHEKLDGSGYPRRVTAAEIPDQSRIMTICDIFDALVASDRPYKRAVPMDKAIAILQDEVKEGKLDPRFFRVFLEARVFDNLEFLALTGQAAPKKKAA